MKNLCYVLESSYVRFGRSQSFVELLVGGVEVLLDLGEDVLVEIVGLRDLLKRLFHRHLTGAYEGRRLHVPEVNLDCPRQPEVFAEGRTAILTPLVLTRQVLLSFISLRVSENGLIYVDLVLGSRCPRSAFRDSPTRVFPHSLSQSGIAVKSF